jgi:hypothetical protein
MKKKHCSSKVASQDLSRGMKFSFFLFHNWTSFLRFRCATAAFDDAKEVHCAHASTMRGAEFEKFVDGSSSDHKNRHDKIVVIVPDKTFTFI